MPTFVSPRCTLALTTLAVASFVVGCGGRPVAQVSGKVLYEDGTPLTGGIRVIRFEPTEDTTAVIKKAADGRIEDDGSFTLKTRKPGDGVIKGQYFVTLTVIKDSRSGESLIPTEYSSKATTPFEVVDVTANKSDYLFEIKKKP